MSKGSTPRPLSVPPDEYAKRFDGIFGKRERKQYVPPAKPSKEK